MGLLDGPLRINSPRELAPAPLPQAGAGRGAGGSATPAAAAPSPAPSASGPVAAELPAESVAPAPQGDLYLARLVKLIPSEVVALYLTFKEVANTWVGIWALVCLGLVVVVRVTTTRSPGKPLQVGAVLIACVSFVLWIYATGGTIANLQLPAAPGLISVSVGVWTFLLPYLYKGAPTEVPA